MEDALNIPFGQRGDRRDHDTAFKEQREEDRPDQPNRQWSGVPLGWERVCPQSRQGLAGTEGKPESPPIWDLGIERIIGLAVIEQIPDPVDGIFEDRGSGKDQHPDLGGGKGDDMKGGSNTWRICSILTPIDFKPFDWIDEPASSGCEEGGAAAPQSRPNRQNINDQRSPVSSFTGMVAEMLCTVATPYSAADIVE